MDGRNVKRSAALGLSLCVALSLWPVAPAEAVLPAMQAPQDFSRIFDKLDVMIPMRDGAELHTDIYVPKNMTEPLPFIMERTPYGLRPDAQGFSGRLGSFTELIEEGYIFVFQDLRGRFKSTGEFRTAPPPRDPKDPDAVDETTDTYDSIEWLVNNVPNNNGRLGFLGISYGGFTTMRAIMEPHPALKAASPQATCADMFIGDDIHHNGAFRLQYNFSWVAAMERSKGMSSFVFDQYDAYEWFLDLGPLSNVDEQYFYGEVPSWNQFVNHPNMDEFWETEMCGVLPFLKEVTVPTLNVIGWFDAEDFYGPLEVYKKLEKRDTKNWNYLVSGPWYHGGWAAEPEGQKLLQFDFGSPTSKYFREEIQARWFAYWLKDKGSLDFPEVLAFQTGSNVWESLDRWPPADRVVERNLYLRSGGHVSFDPPETTEEDAFDSYVSDPGSPVPYLPRPIRGSVGWSTWQLVDQRFVHMRPDVLTWESEPLEEGIAVTGDIVAHLFASSTGSDSDWIVKLIDVYPDDYEPNPELRGYQFMVAGEVFRGRFRNSFREPEPAIPGEVTPYAISLRDRNHRFQKGHRIMVQVQSTWFPMIDLNPQRYIANIFKATEEDIQKATQRVYRSRRFPSHVTLPVRRD